MSFVEITHLLDTENKQPMDLTMMLNAEREQNGASLKWLNSFKG